MMTSLMRVKCTRKELGGLSEISVSLCHISESKFVRSFYFTRFRIFLERVQQNNTYLGGTKTSGQHVKIAHLSVRKVLTAEQDLFYYYFDGISRTFRISLSIIIYRRNNLLMQEKKANLPNSTCSNLIT